MKKIFFEALIWTEKTNKIELNMIKGSEILSIEAIPNLPPRIFFLSAVEGTLEKRTFEIFRVCEDIPHLTGEGQKREYIGSCRTNWSGHEHIFNTYFVFEIIVI